MNFKYLKYLIYTDYFRIAKNLSIKDFLLSLIFTEGFKYCFWMRLCSYLSKNKFLRFPFYYFVKGILRRYTHKYGISIPFTTTIGTGFYIGHFGGIIVNSKTIIGNNCNISQGVTIGIKNRGKNIGTLIIGNNVYIGPGAKIFGNLKIGNNVAIGANCVVANDIPDNSVVVGIPGKIISNDGSIGYIQNIHYKTFENY